MPEIQLRDKCDRCGHSFSFHGKSVHITCRAMGCKGGPDGQRCPGFVPVPDRQSLSAPS